MPVDRKGLGGNVIFIDTGNTFRAERIFQIAEHKGIDDPDQVLRRIYVCKIYNTSHLEMIIQDLGKSIEEYKAKLVMVDSIISLHRAEFIGGNIGGALIIYLLRLSERMTIRCRYELSYR
jgi:DNA repair protein RadA